MSRSFKKSPWICDRNPEMKKKFNRRFRKSAPYEFADGKAYRKFSQSYDICDFKWLTDEAKWLRK